METKIPPVVGMENENQSSNTGAVDPQPHTPSLAQPYVNPSEKDAEDDSPLVWIGLSFAAMCLIVFTAYALSKRMKKPQRARGDSEDGFIPWTKSKPVLQRKPAVMISHSLPDLSRSVSQEQLLPQESNNRKGSKVSRQTTLPTVPQRHASFQRQLSHRLNLDGVEFAVCSLRRKDKLGNIKPELYRSDLLKQDSVDSSQGSDDADSAGKLSFSLNYDTEMENLVVKVIQAQDLPIKDVTGSSDPYVKVYLLPDRMKKFCTKVHRRNLSPVFNETFLFSVPFDDLCERTLQFSVYDFDRFSRNDIIGQVLVRRIHDQVQAGVELEFVHDILTTKQSLGVQVAPDGTQYKDAKDIGELMISLCYLPKAGRLTVTVIKMRNLRALDITGYSDPYVKVSMLCQGRRIKKKKTSVKKATLNPVYNESLVFDVPNENIQDITLLVKVLDYDRVGANELLGVLVIGSQAVGQGRDHWLEMLQSSRIPVAQWYQLQDSVPASLTPSPSKNPPLSACLSLSST